MAASLTGKRAIVTGGAGGMGRNFALRLAACGADVAIFDIDLDVAKQWGEELTAPTVVDEIRGAGVDGLAVQVDLTDAAATQRAVQEVVAKWSKIDVLVNVAGGAITPFDQSSPTGTSDEDAHRVVALNLMTTLNTCRAAAPHLRRPGASVINISTIGVEKEIVGGKLALYAAAKAAVVRYTRSLAVELGPEGIRVNSVAPGLIETARIRAVAATRPQMAGDDPAATIPLRRAGSPDDVAGVVEFLASDLSAYVTGDNIRAGGGIHLI
jgi:NAD(P)-dependent dehydrogenase (short-subunit alcohol dehydrogenase family)